MILMNQRYALRSTNHYLVIKSVNQYNQCNPEEDNIRVYLRQ